MAFQTIGVGTSANDGTGDPLRTAIQKVNTNFTETLNKTGDIMSGQLAFSGTDTAGLKVKSLTTAQINALTPAVGMVVYDTTVGKYKAYGTLGWFELDGNVFNVKSFGAKGDGSTNDTAAINAATAALRATSATLVSGVGGTTTRVTSTLYIPPGVYACSGSLDFTEFLDINFVVDAYGAI